ncbi:hypothetical protein FZEAL_334 [Fusarium zealandicum]|uniref:Uncharacterized protein n=1 Tax=Fusarium zealandicum TaxID=1053134 RepID=A0A8H4UVL6_9HYPO|nr:hypothetical protein FZEAL_334 [Fusarium zealandicum]
MQRGLPARPLIAASLRIISLGHERQIAAAAAQTRESSALALCSIAILVPALNSWSTMTWTSKQRLADSATPGGFLATLLFRKQPCETIAGATTILHHSMAVPGNITAIKTLLVHWNTAFQNGDITIDNAKAITAESSIVDQVPNKGYPNLDELECPTQPEWLDNRYWKDPLPKTHPSMFSENGRINGFVYNVPYVSILAYSPDLHDELAKFAKAHHKNKFNAAATIRRSAAGQHE